MDKYFTVQQAAEMLGVDEEQILFPINTGELVAVNVAKSPNGKRPRWRIAESELGRFLLKRRNSAPQSEAKPAKNPRSRDVTEFYV